MSDNLDAWVAKGLLEDVTRDPEGAWLAMYGFGPGAPHSATSTAYTNQMIVCGGPAKLFSITGYNSKASAQWIQVFDTTGLPSNGAVPKIIATVATVANFSITFGSPGRWFYQGIVVANSSTGPTLTLGSADTWFDVQYI